MASFLFLSLAQYSELFSSTVIMEKASNDIVYYFSDTGDTNRFQDSALAFNSVRTS